MQPQQPSYGTPQPGQAGHDPYGFIVNPPKANRPSLFGGGSSPALRALLVLAGIFGLVVIFVIIKAVLGGSGDSNSALLVAVAQDQQELVHLSTTGSQDAVSQASQNFAITTQLSLASEQSQLLSYLKTNRIKASTKQLALKQSASLDSQLTSAQTASDFDPTFSSVMQQQLTTYERDLQLAYAQTHGPKGRALLSADYNGASLLLKQLAAPAS